MCAWKPWRDSLGRTAYAARMKRLAGIGLLAVLLAAAQVLFLPVGRSAQATGTTGGSVVGWGDNSYGQASPPAGLTGVIAIAAGQVHSLALKSDGTVVGWGWNDYGQASPPP